MFIYVCIYVLVKTTTSYFSELEQLYLTDDI